MDTLMLRRNRVVDCEMVLRAQKIVGRHEAAERHRRQRAVNFATVLYRAHAVPAVVPIGQRT